MLRVSITQPSAFAATLGFGEPHAARHARRRDLSEAR
jgi:hypothetical protein